MRLMKRFAQTVTEFPFTTLVISVLTVELVFLLLSR